MMPHFHIDYSGNIEDQTDIAGLCEAMRSAAEGLETFPTAGVRVRALRVDHYAIADGNPDHGFVDISVRLRAGRSPSTKAHAAKVLFETARAFLSDYMETHSLAISLEMRDIDPELSPKTGNIREYLEARS